MQRDWRNSTSTFSEPLADFPLRPPGGAIAPELAPEWVCAKRRKIQRKWVWEGEGSECMPLKSRKRPRLQRDGASAILDIIGRQAALLHPPMLHSQPYFLTQTQLPLPLLPTDEGTETAAILTRATEVEPGILSRGPAKVTLFPSLTPRY